MDFFQQYYVWTAGVYIDSKYTTSNAVQISIQITMHTLKAFPAYDLFVWN